MHRDGTQGSGITGCRIWRTRTAERWNGKFGLNGAKEEKLGVKVVLVMVISSFDCECVLTAKAE